MSKRPLNPKVGLYVFLTFALLMLCQGLYDAYGCVRSSAWPHTNGTITKSSMFRARKKGWTPIVEYSYSVGEQHMTSRRIRYGAFSSRATKREVVARFKENTVVSVYYDPDNPTKSVLIPGPHSGLWTYPLLALAFSGAGCFFGLLLPKISRYVSDDTNKTAEPPGGGYR